MPRKKNSKAKAKKSEQCNNSILAEIFLCKVIDCNIVDGDSVLIYQKQSDKTLNCCLVHPSVNSSVIISNMKKTMGPVTKAILGGRPFCWIAIWNYLDGLYIRNIATSFEGLIQEVSDMKSDTAIVTEARFTIPAFAGEDYSDGGEDSLDDQIPF